VGITPSHGRKVGVSYCYTPQLPKGYVSPTLLFHHREGCIRHEVYRYDSAVYPCSARIRAEKRIRFATGMHSETCVCALSVSNCRCEVEPKRYQHSRIPNSSFQACIVLSHVERVREIRTTPQESTGLSVSSRTRGWAVLEARQHEDWVIRKKLTWLRRPRWSQDDLERFYPSQWEVLGQF